MRILFLYLLLANVAAADYRIDLFAGTGVKGYAGDGGKASDAQINNPFGIVKGADGALYICDTSNHVIRKVDAKGVISTVAGTGEAGLDGGENRDPLKTRLNEPYEIRFDPAGDLVWVEMQNHLVRRLDAKTGKVSVIAGTGAEGFKDNCPATEAIFKRPHSIQFDRSGSLFICDIGNHRLRKVGESGIAATFAGTGKRAKVEDGAAFATAPLNGPRAIDFDTDGNLWLALREGNQVWKLDVNSGKMHHIAGTGEKGFGGNGGPAKEATLSGPKGVSVGPDGNIYLADTESHSIRMIDLSANPPVLRLIAGTGKKGVGKAGDALTCAMARPHGVFVDTDGKIYVGDSENHRVWVITKVE